MMIHSTSRTIAPMTIQVVTVEDIWAAPRKAKVYGIFAFDAFSAANRKATSPENAMHQSMGSGGRREAGRDMTPTRRGTRSATNGCVYWGGHDESMMRR